MEWLNGPAGEAAAIVLTLVVLAFGVLFVVVLNVVVIWDGVHQMLEGRPSFLPIDRVFRRRLPATAADCILQGASKVFSAIGVFLVTLPLLINSVVLLADISGAQLHGVGEMIVLLAGFAICWPIGITLGVSSIILDRRVHYIQLGSNV